MCLVYPRSEEVFETVEALPEEDALPLDADTLDKVGAIIDLIFCIFSKIN